MPADKKLLDSVRNDIITYSSTIIEHGYTGRIDDDNADQIINSMIVSIVSRRLVCVNEFMKGLQLFGLSEVIQKYPEACKEIFIMGSDDVNANYLFSLMYPEYSEDGTTLKQIEESIMDLFQDFLFSLEDDKICLSTQKQCPPMMMMMTRQGHQEIMKSFKQLTLHQLV